MIKEYFICLLMFTGVLSGVSAQNATGIRGKVTTPDKTPAEGVNITIKGSTSGTVTDRHGNFELPQIGPGTYTLVVSYIGYRTIQKEIEVANGEIITLPAITLQESTEELDGITLTGAAKIFAEKKSDMVARMPLKNLENPQVYTVVPKELLTEQIATDFRGALLSSPGVTNVMLGVGSGGTGLSMRMRGFSGADGAGSIRNGMATNFVSLSDPVNLERLEIIKGPSSTLFGSTLISYGGLVNRVTKKPFSEERGEVGLTAGGYGLGRVTLDYNTPLNEEKTFLFRLNTAIHREKSFQDQGINRTFMIAPAFQYHVSEKLTLNLDMEYFESERNSTYVGIGSAKINSFDDLHWDFQRSYASNDVTSSAKVLNVFANAEFVIDEHWTSDSRVSYSNTDNNANYLFLLVNSGTGAYEGQKTLQRRLMNLPSNFNTIQFQQNFTAAHQWENISNKLVFGFDYTQLQTTDSRTTIGDYDKLNTKGDTITVLNQDAPVINVNTYQDALAGQTRAANHRDTQTFSAYVSDVVTVFDRLHIMAGLRVDRFHDRANAYLQTAWSPKFGLVYQIVANQVSLFANYQNGFRNVAPSNLSDDTRLVFKPENANQIEGGVKFELLHGMINGTVSYYNIKVQDKVRSVFNDNNELVSVQDGTQSSEGLEFDLIANPFRGFHIIAGYGYNDSRLTKVGENQADQEGNRPAATPYNSANYWASYKISDGKLQGLGFGFGGNYSDGYFFNDANTVKVSGFHTLDASVFFEQPKFRVGLKLNNLANKEYWMATSWAIPQQTRTFLANLTFRF
ncbi:iron complex outermembrane recepter protein [Sinomicrobium oceani]|uniref:Iron complex outermembrane recepter protein n=1 Tax=Sinomicrobium oceani TaxID=1150368 RepID=A0A1K1PP39_9FLAO|nr:TonB-dependent receptor [Sinomicrobium oceani]SFW49197.1 iron complex outermembrane recepter protein [Sinomicrobium oceani]